MPKKISSAETTKFRRLIKDFYKKNRRAFAWRDVTDPYAIVVSEIMLQQTQTERVTKKFPEFLTNFPTFEMLAKAPLEDLLRTWQGMGYNRRAIALQKIAVRVIHEFGGILPNNPEMLTTFPGIGPNTAGSICAFAFNAPTIFIETNIRSVFLHHFFPKKKNIHDNKLLPLIEQTLDRKHPRDWYYALMDYGVYLKKLHPNPSRRSTHHIKQSKFEGSDRQIRGKILRLLLKFPSLTIKKLLQEFPSQDHERTERLVHTLKQEGFLTVFKQTFSLTNSASSPT
jgi:A/G-specific adenine glycosylase